MKLTTSEKVGTLSIGGGELVYGGTIFADKLSVSAADAVKVVFSSEDLASHDIIVVDFEYLSDDFDVNSALVAFDENGNELGGEFILNGSVGEGRTLVYSVPELYVYLFSGHDSIGNGNCAPQKKLNFL